MTVKSSISLTDEQAAFARKMVEEGRYPPLSAVLQQGLNMLRDEVETAELDKAALKQLLDKRAEGPFISEDEMDKRMDAMIARKRAEYGL